VPTRIAVGTSALWQRTTWKLHIEQILWQKIGITPLSRTYTLTNTLTHTEDTDPMTKKYFPNNYNRIAKSPAEWFEPMEYDILMDWKMNGWEIMPTHNCIIRTVNCETGKVKEYTYQKQSAAKKRLQQLLNEYKHELIICTHDNIQHLKPDKYITEHDEENFYPQ